MESASDVQNLAAAAASGDREAQDRFLRLGSAAFPMMRDALSHPDWKVRRNCLRFLDHHVNPELAQAVLERLEQDSHPDVRKWAAHALGCDHCKEGADLGFDPVPHLITAVQRDTSVRVRRSAVVCLAWNLPPDARILAFLETLVRDETDEKIRLHAKGGIARHRGISPAA